MHPAVPSPPCTPREHQVFKLRDGKIAIRSVDNQKVAWRLARNWSRVAKREREREAAKVANLPSPPPRERQREACGQKFNSRKNCQQAQVLQFQSSADWKESSREAKEASHASQPTPLALQSQTRCPPQSPPTHLLPHHTVMSHLQ